MSLLKSNIVLPDVAYSSISLYVGIEASCEWYHGYNANIVDSYIESSGVLSYVLLDDGTSRVLLDDGISFVIIPG